MRQINIKNKSFLILLIFYLIFFNVKNFSSHLLLASRDSISRREKDQTIEDDFYLLGPGDIISLNLFDAPEFNGEYNILSDGRVTLPLIGSVKLSNLNLTQAIELTQKLYSNELLRPELFLSIFVPRPVSFSITGEIEKPGIYTFSTPERKNIDDIDKIPNKLVNAIESAGGITQFANLKNVKILRRLSGQENNYKEINIDLLDLILNGNHSQNPILFDGDIIKIAKAKTLSPEIMTIARANFSPKDITISVIGEVSSPGRIKVNANTPLNQAILMAGGPIAWKSNRGDVELIRINSNGSAFRKKYKIDLSQGVSQKFNPVLSNRDIIRVNSTKINN